MTTQALLTQATWDLLYGIGGFERSKSDRVSGAISSGATDLSALVDTPAMWRINDIMEFPDGELAKNIADGAANVLRGWDGTTAAAHSTNDEIFKNSDFPRGRVEGKVSDVIRNGLWPHVWTWFLTTTTFVVADHLYDLPQYIEGVALVYQTNLNSDNRMWYLPNGWWDVERQISAAVATNSNLLRLRKVWDEDETVNITAKRRPHVDDLTNVSDEIADMIPYGAAAKLALGRNIASKRDLARQLRESSTAFQADYGGFKTEFEQMRDELHLLLLDEVKIEPRFRPRQRRRW